MPPKTFFTTTPSYRLETTEYSFKLTNIFVI